jgi:hypothetical protein
MTPGDVSHYPVNELEVFEEQLVVIHLLMGLHGDYLERYSG